MMFHSVLYSKFWKHWPIFAKKISNQRFLIKDTKWRVNTFHKESYKTFSAQQRTNLIHLNLIIWPWFIQTDFDWYILIITSYFWLTCFSPEGHDVTVGTETRHTHALAHLHHVRPQDEGRFCDTVFVDAGLGGEGHDFGLFLRTHHSVLALVEVLGAGGRHWDGPALTDLLSFFAICCNIGFIPRLERRGQHGTWWVKESHPQEAALQPDQHAWWLKGRGLLLKFKFKFTIFCISLSSSYIIIISLYYSIFNPSCRFDTYL